MKKVFLLVILSFLILYGQNDLVPVTPPELRGSIDMERQGLHDANKIRTLFYNFGMVGDYPPNPLKVDYSVFHSVEVPKGSGENYSDGITPFVLAKVVQRNGKDAYIMETGYRERQGISPRTGKIMRFEPRPGYFQTNPSINVARSVAISNDPRTWPDKWIDKIDDPFDPGWSGSWNGYFGKIPKADQESFVVYDDNFYDAWNFFPDTRDSTRRGLGLRIEQRGFQWSNPQSGYVIFFHYDITNESTTNYDDNIIFGLYMDSGVGGSSVGIDGIPESDDDNAYFSKEIGLNLVYTWDNYGHGFQGPTGYLGYSYLETPGNEYDTKDNDEDGIVNESRVSGPGILIEGQDNIRAYVQTHYDLTKFEQYYGKLENRPAFKAGYWWTGDEDMDWIMEFHDTGEDGVFDTYDVGERDGIPTKGETNFDKTDIDESDQIGLTGFKMNRIRPGYGNPSQEVDQIVFFDDGKNWPMRLYNIFTDPDSAFDKPLILNYNIGFLFASGPFKLKAGKTERFSLALGFGEDLRELKTITKVVQQIYKANYQFAVPPPLPTVKAYAGDKYVTLTWDDAAERAFDPITYTNDFEGYKIYRSTDPSFLDPQIILTATGSSPIGNGKPIAQFDLINDIEGFSKTTVEGIAYFLGSNTGLTHSWTDTTVKNGQRYFYAVCAYDRGADSIGIYPSENAISVSQTLRGGFVLPKNVVMVTPNPPTLGYIAPEIYQLEHSKGNGIGTITLVVKNPDLVPDDNLYEITFSNHPDSVRAQYYVLKNLTRGETLFYYGNDLDSLGNGVTGDGILPIINTLKHVEIDSTLSGVIKSSQTNLKVRYRYSPVLPFTLRRTGFPADIEIIFSKYVLDTTIAAVGAPSKPVKFLAIAKTDSGNIKLKIRFRDINNDSTLSEVGEYIEVLTFERNSTIPKPTWRIEVDTSGMGSIPIIAPSDGDKIFIKLKVPFSQKDTFTFKTRAHRIDINLAKEQFKNEPYVVPNPYVNAASFEPQRYAVSGRGERKIEFRNLPNQCTIRIYTITGELVKELHHNGTITEGYITWDLRTKDNLEVAPGLYIYHVESQEIGSFIGKFAIIK